MNLSASNLTTQVITRTQRHLGRYATALQARRFEEADRWSMRIARLQVWYASRQFGFGYGEGYTKGINVYLEAINQSAIAQMGAIERLVPFSVN